MTALGLNCLAVRVTDYVHFILAPHDGAVALRPLLNRSAFRLLGNLVAAYEMVSLSVLSQFLKWKRSKT